MTLERRAPIADAVGLGLMLLALLDYLDPSLLFLSTYTAGGDTPCHVPTAAWLHEELLPRWRLHGWYPGAYLGQPLLLYYFPLPFLVMSALTPVFGPLVAFKLGSVAGVFAFPLLVYAGLRAMGYRFPAPLLGTAAACVFFFLEENPIWGGTLASTLTGEFSQTYGIGLAVLFVGLVYRAYSRGQRPWLPAAALALTALAHGYAVLWAGLSATYFLYASRRPWHTLRFLAGVAAFSFALAAFFLLPLLKDWGWTTPYDDPWISIATQNLVPPLLWPVFGIAGAGLLWTLTLSWGSGGPDQRFLFLLHAALVGAGLAAVAPVAGVIDVRLVPFAQLALCLAGGVWLGSLVSSWRLPDAVALGCVLLALAWADAHSRVLRGWVEYNYSGLEARELWPDWQRLNALLAGDANDPRVAVEYSPVHEKAGSIRMYETLPHFSGRSTLEGVYNQASLSTHAVYYLASELGERSPNPFKKVRFAHFDTQRALEHLRLFNAREVVALSEKLRASLDERDDVTLVERVGPYAVYRLRDHGPGYVEALTHEPVRSSLAGFRAKAHRWLRRDPTSPAMLVFSDDAQRFPLAERDEWLPPPQRRLEPGVEVSATLAPERIAIHTSRPGHPLLVKVSYHPRWRARGAHGPYLVAPSLMLVVPTQPDVELTYGRDWSDWLGLALTLVALAGAWSSWRRSLRPAGPPPKPVLGVESVPLRWGGVIPGGLLLLMLAGRLLLPTEVDRGPLVAELTHRAQTALSEGRSADAAEYAWHALDQQPEEPARGILLCVRGEALLALGRLDEARAEFEQAAGLDVTDVRERALSGLQAVRDRAAASP